MLLLKPAFRILNDTAGNIIKKYSGGLILLDKVSDNETTLADKNNIIGNLEEDNDEIIARFLHDSYLHREAGAGLLYASPETPNITGDSIGADDINPYLFGSAGWFLEFEILWPISATPDKSKWTDPQNIE